MKTGKGSKDSPGATRSPRGDGAGEVKGLLKGGLYLVATPIGNLRDITLRALDVLRDCDLILCEDTRVTRKLLSAYEIRSPTLSYHDHSDDAKRDTILARLRAGQVLALVSDAGMPMISDPGYKLVRACVQAGLPVTSLPGANAPLAALQLSGLPSDRFCFLGFLSAKSGVRRKALMPWAEVDSTLVFFESPRRLPAMLADLEAVMPGREIAVVREITKMFEEVRRGSVSVLIAHYEQAGLPKGEVVVVVGPPTGEVKKVGEKDVKDRLRSLLANMKTKEAANVLAEETGMSRKDAYALALRLVGEGI